MAKILIEVKNSETIRDHLVTVGVKQEIVDSMISVRFEFDEADLVESSGEANAVKSNVLIPTD